MKPFTKMQVRDSWQPPMYFASYKNIFGVAPASFLMQRIETGEQRCIESYTLEQNSDQLVGRALTQTLQGIQKKKFDPLPESWKCSFCTVSQSCPHSLDN